MANGLLGNLLGQSSNATSGLFGGPGIFSSAPTRSERRERLLSDAIGRQQTSSGRLGAAFGGLIGTALSGVGPGTQEEQQNEAIREVQQTVSQEGLDPLDPGFGERVAELFTERNFPELATRSLLQARQLQSQFAPEPIEPATFFNQETNEYVRGGYRQGVAVNEQGQPLGQGFVERDFETPKGPGSYDTYYSSDGETAVQARVENGKLKTLAGEDITGQGYGTSRGGSLVSTDRSEEIATEEALKNSQQIQERNVALSGVVRSANDILTLAEQSKGTSLGVVGDIVRIGQGLTAQAQTAANAMGFSLDPNNYDFGAFPDASSKEAAQRTETLALAYNILRAREPQARQFSNADIQNTLDTIGGNSGSYQQLYSQLSQVVRSSLSSANESYQSQVRTFEGTDVQAPLSPTEYLKNLESPIAGVSYDIPLFTQYGDLQERRAAEDFVNEAVQEGSLPPNTSLGNFDSNTNSFEILDEKGNVVQELQVERGQ